MYNLNMQDKIFITVFTDGGSRGNPGEAAYGFYITDYTGGKLAGVGKRIGIDTNNVAEYMGVINALQWLIDHKSELGENLKINFFMDSRLVVMQVTGLFRVKNSNLQNLLKKVRDKQAELDCEITFTYIPREENKMADKFVNLALDNLI